MIITKEWQTWGLSQISESSNCFNLWDVFSTDLYYFIQNMNTDKRGVLLKHSKSLEYSNTVKVGMFKHSKSLDAQTQ